MLRPKRLTPADRSAIATVVAWATEARAAAARRMVRDPDLRLVARPYPMGAGFRVVTLRDGVHVAWFDSERAARFAIESADSRP